MSKKKWKISKKTEKGGVYIELMVLVYLCIIFFVEKACKWCYKCSGCIAKECDICKHCLDKPKYGGLGIQKQCCVKRKGIMIKESCTKKEQVMAYTFVCATDAL